MRRSVSATSGRSKILSAAFAKVESDQKELEKLRRRDADSQFYPKLRKLEGADFDSPFNFAWDIDFPGVFAGENGGFDIIVGNPPFVTARNRRSASLEATMAASMRRQVPHAVSFL